MSAIPLRVFMMGECVRSKVTTRLQTKLPMDRAKSINRFTKSQSLVATNIPPEDKPEIMQNSSLENQVLADEEPLENIGTSDQDID